MGGYSVYSEDYLPPLPSYALPPPEGGYLTQLDPEQEAQFQDWVKKNKVPFDPSSTADYDMRGFWKGVQEGDPHAVTGDVNGQLHYGDYYKTPYHKSFSNESKFAAEGAPSWNDKNQLVSSSGEVLFDEATGGKPLPKSTFGHTLASVVDTLAALKKVGESTGQLAIDPSKLLNLPGHIIEGVKRTGDSWNKALNLLRQGYEPSDPEVLKYAFDIATNMLPGGIAIKEASRVPRGTPQAASETSKGVKINEQGLMEIDITKPPKAEDLTGQSSKMGGGPQPKLKVPSDTVSFQDKLDEVTQMHADGLITVQEAANKKMLIQQEEIAASKAKNLGSEGYVGGADAATIKKQTPYFTPTMYTDPLDPAGKWVVEYKGQKTNFNTKEGAENHFANVEKTDGVVGKFYTTKQWAHQQAKTGPLYKVGINTKSDGGVEVTTFRPNKDGTIETLNQTFDKNDNKGVVEDYIKWAHQQANDANKAHGYPAAAEQKLPASALSPYEVKEAAGGEFHIFEKGPNGGLKWTGISSPTEEGAHKIIDQYNKMAAAYPGMVKPAHVNLTKAADDAQKTAFINQVSDYVHKDMPKDAWYDKLDISRSGGEYFSQNVGTFLTNRAYDQPELVRATMEAHSQGIDKVFYHDSKTGHLWIVDLRPKNMKTAAPSELEKQFPNATRIDTINPEPDALHPGPLIAYHGTGIKFQSKATPKGPAEMEFADVTKSADIGWHFGTTEQATYRGLGRGADGAKVIPAYLNIKKPFYMPDLGGWNPVGMADTIVKQLEEQATHVSPGPMKAFELRSARKMQAKVEDLMQDYSKANYKESYQTLRTWLDKHGYDSIRYLNEAEGEGWSYIVWNKGKVKSAPTPEHTLYVAPGFPKIDPRGQEQAQD